MTYVITLVHGTKLFAPIQRAEPSFYDPKSVLQSRLTAQLPVGTRFELFRWSGGNSILARRSAARRLRSQLLQTIEAEPDAQHFIVGHSHGGTISFYALRDDDLRRRVSGVICLSTPFPVARRRDLGEYGDSHLWALAFLANYALLLLVLNTCFGGTIGDWAGRLPDLLERGVYLVLGLITLVPFVLLWALWDETTDWAIRALSLPIMGEGTLLLIRGSGDEAIEALGAARFLSWVCTTAWLATTAVAPFLSGVADKMKRASRVRKTAWLCVGGSIVGWVFGATIAGAINADVDGPWSYPFSVVLVAGAFILILPWYVQPVATAAGFLSALLALPLIVVTGVLCAVFGPELVAANLLLDVSAEATPPGKWEVLEIDKLQYAHADRDPLPRLRHAIYDDPTVAAHIARWIAARGQL